MPPLICGVDTAGAAISESSRPPMRSVNALPLKGTCSISIPAVSLKSSPERCCVVRTPGVANVSLPGLALAALIRSRSVLIGDSAGTIRMNGNSTTVVMKA